MLTSTYILIYSRWFVYDSPTTADWLSIPWTINHNVAQANITPGHECTKENQIKLIQQLIQVTQTKFVTFVMKLVFFPFILAKEGRLLKLNRIMMEGKGNNNVNMKKCVCRFVATSCAWNEHLMLYAHLCRIIMCCSGIIIIIMSLFVVIMRKNNLANKFCDLIYLV